MVSIHPRISHSSSLFSKPLWTFQSVRTIIGIPRHTHVPQLFQLTGKRFNLYFRFIFTLWSAGTAKSTWCQVLFSCLLTLNLLFWPGLGDLFVSKNPREFFCVLFSRMDFGLSSYYLLAWSNFNHLHSYRWSTFPTMSDLVLYFFFS